MNKLVIITLPSYLDAFRGAVTECNSKAVLLNLEDSNYVATNGVFYYKGTALFEDEIFDLAATQEKNKPILDNLILYGIFSYLYTQKDLRNHAEFVINENELCRFLGLSTGVKGFNLLAKLKNLSSVNGVIKGVGTFPVLEIKEQEIETFVLKSEYMHLLLIHILDDCINNYGEYGKYYTTKLYANVVGERNHTSALIAIELTKLFVRANGFNAHMRIKHLFFKVPSLLEIKGTPSYRNKQLRRAFSTVTKILCDKSDFYKELVDFNIDIPEINITKLNGVIKLTASRYLNSKKKGSNKNGSKNIY